MKIIYTGYDDINFWLAASPLEDHKGYYGFFIELCRRRIDIRFRNRKDIQDES